MLCLTWDLPRPGLEPGSPAFAGGILTTAPLGKSPHWELLEDRDGSLFCAESPVPGTHSLTLDSLNAYHGPGVVLELHCPIEMEFELRVILDFPVTTFKKKKKKHEKKQVKLVLAIYHI